MSKKNKIKILHFSNENIKCLAVFQCWEFGVKMLNCHGNNATMQIKKGDLSLILGPEDECEQMHLLHSV